MPIPNVSITVVDGALGSLAPSTASVGAHLGTCQSGAANTVYSFTDPQTALNTLGQGPLTEAVCHSLAVAGGQVIAVPVNPSVAGSVGSFVHTGAGAGVVSISSGTPYDGYELIVKVIAGGALGTATFQYSLDNGNNWSPTYTTAATFIIPNTGITLGFTSANYTAGDTYAATAVAPGFAGTDVTAALNALLANPATWGFVHLVGTQTTVSAAATMGTLLNAALDSAASTNFRYAFGILEVPADTDANIQAAFNNLVYDRTMVCVGQCRIVSPISGNFYTRSSGFPVAARNALVAPSEDLGYPGRGVLGGVKSITRDESVTPALDAVGFTTLRTLVGQPGFYVTSGHMFEPVTSDYYLSQNRRVMDQACITTRAALLNFLNGSLRVVSTTGAIYPADASKIENYTQSLLNAAILAPGFCSGTSVVVNRANNILSTKQLLVNTRVTPLGYMKQIIETIAFLNPALAGAAS